jgi:hypothetical protein
VNGTTTVHKKIMKDTPIVKKPEDTAIAVPLPIQKEIFLILIQSAAADGRFLLGNLPNAQAVVKQGDHLKGVSELLANCYEK